MCRFMSQEMGEKAHFFVAMLRVFPLSVHETLREKYKTITHKFTHLSTRTVETFGALKSYLRPTNTAMLDFRSLP